MRVHLKDRTIQTLSLQSHLKCLCLVTGQRLPRHPVNDKHSNFSASVALNENQRSRTWIVKAFQSNSMIDDYTASDSDSMPSSLLARCRQSHASAVSEPACGIY
eukprot:2330269-Amphidinium_carterae.1